MLARRNDGLGALRGVANGLLFMAGFVTMGLAYRGHPEPLVAALLVSAGYVLGRSQRPPVSRSVLRIDPAAYRAAAARKKTRSGEREVGSSREVPDDGPAAA